MCEHSTSLDQIGFVVSDRRRLEPVVSAFTGTAFWGLASTAPRDLPGAVSDGRLAQQRWHSSTLEHRCDVLRTLYGALRKARPLMAAALAHGCGLGAADAAAEQRAAERLLSSCGRAVRRQLGYGQRWGRRSGRSMTDTRVLPQARTTAFCADTARPLVSLLEGLLPALLAGSSATALVTAGNTGVAALLARAARTAGVPEGLWQWAVSNSPSARAVLRAVLAEHAELWLPSCCQDAGSSPGALAAVRHDASVGRAANSAAAACFARAGRLCTGPSVITVHHRHWREFQDSFRQALLHMAAHTSHGSVLQEGEYEFAYAWARELLEAGARPLLGPHSRLEQPVRPGETTLPTVVAADTWYQQPLHTIPRGPVVLLVRSEAWSDTLYLARRTNRHVGIFTRTPPDQLLPQFATLGCDVRFNGMADAGIDVPAALRRFRCRGIGKGPLPG
ncbi:MULTISPECIES: aldehyde dehydrogenase family protein [Streptomyces]|uniref:aldehyde dehydrogenase family protein n=1 Tax=Streptomyces TaxID=1883 RepID=UPI001E5FDE09|nr:MULTISPECIES: aldehyde dehydrogenase family protein [Streptomyces]UFQ19887.1 aldehyde dehydrogenase family protein [Streptomyces huasconensis]WCL89510.1 aldehyde dehydrogenase family protein [Streptomyces sp. JCM 35825]